MSQNQEIIEAKLCAYVDGELDPEGRSEIEKHLEANPQHRRLLESLRATRDLLKWLPREPAPPELAETLNGQLERSVLLDDDQEISRRHVFPRILAAAAIIVLTVGLAAAVFFALPKSQRNVVAIRNAADSNSHPALSAAHPVGPSTLPYSLDEGSRQGSQSVEKLADEENSMAAGPPAARAMEVGKRQASQESREELERLANQVTQNSASYWTKDAAVLRAATEPLNHALVVLVRSNNPDDAQKQLTEYLQTNGIQWKPAEPASSTGDVASEQVRQLSSNKAAANRADNVFNYKQFGAQAATSQPVQPDRPITSHAPAVQQNAPAQQAEDVLEHTGNPGNNLYVARMSRRQAAELTNCIARDGTQSAQLTDPLNAAANGPRDGRSKLEMVARSSDETQEPQSPTTTPSLRNRGTLREVESSVVPSGDLKQKTAAVFGRGLGPSGDLRAGVESAPTTQPAAAAALPEDEQPVDVVIVVQPNEAAGPTTQPSAGPQNQPSLAPTPAQ